MTNKKSPSKPIANKVKYKLFPKNIILPTVISNLMEEKVKQNPPDFSFDLIRAKLFLWIIMDKSINDWNIESLNEYVAIPARTLKNYSPNHYSQYLNYLEDVNLIERLNHKNFKDDSRCKMFRLSSETLTALWDSEVHFTVVNLEELKSKVRINFRKYKIEPWLYSEFPYLMTWFNKNLTIDFSSAEAFVASSCFNSDQNYRYLYVLNNLKESNFYAKMNKNSDGRLHTNLSNFPKIFRQFLRYKGEGLVSYDLKSSQPFFLISLIEKLIEFKSCEEEALMDNDKIIKKIEEISRRKKDNNSYIMQELREVLYSSGFTEEFEIFKGMYHKDIYNELGKIIIRSEDEINYRGIDEDGNQIYNQEANPIWVRNKLIEYVCKYSKKRKGKKVPVQFDCKRDMMKVIVLNILYGGIKNKGIEYRAFDNFFPLISQVLSIFKQHDTKEFPMLLQQIESECVLKVVAENLAKKHTEMPIWTIHDSIITTESFANKLDLKTEIQILVDGYCNVTPLVEEEYFCKGRKLKSG